MKHPHSLTLRLFGHGLQILYKPTRLFQGALTPWHIQVMRLKPLSAHTVLWINNNPFAKHQYRSDAMQRSAQVPCLRLPSADVRTTLATYNPFKRAP